MAAHAVTVPSEAGGRLPAGAQRVLVALVVGGAAAILDSTIVTIALRRLTVDLGSTTATISWVVTAYLLALAVAVPLSGWAQARFGGKRVWITALLIFVTSSAACATAWNDASLIAFRAVQGLGAGLIFPLMQTLAMQTVGSVSEQARRTAVVGITVPLALGPILGPVVGGVVLNWLDWRWMFLINVPLVAVGIVLAVRMIPPDGPVVTSGASRLDAVGLCLLAPGLVGVLLGLSNTASDGGLLAAEALAPLAGGAVLLLAFVGWALRRSGGAIVDIALLRARSLASASGALFMAGAALYAGMVLLPLYFQQVHGAGVLEAAVLLVPQGIGALLSRVVAGMLIGRVGARAVTVGAFVVAAAGTVPFAFADASSSVWWLGAALFVRGLGVGAVIIAPILVAYADVSHDQMPHATMTTRIVQQIGGSVGAASVTVALHVLAAAGLTAAFRGAFWWTVAITLVALLPALAFGRQVPTPA